MHGKGYDDFNRFRRLSNKTRQKYVDSTENQQILKPPTLFNGKYNIVL